MGICGQVTEQRLDTCIHSAYALQALYTQYVDLLLIKLDSQKKVLYTLCSLFKESSLNGLAKIRVSTGTETNGLPHKLKGIQLGE